MLGFPSGSVVKNPPASAGDRGSIPGREDALEEELATHSSIIAWKIPLTEAWQTSVHRVAKSQTRLSTHTY